MNKTKTTKGINDMRPLRDGEIEIAFDLRFVPKIRDTRTKIHTMRRDVENKLVPGAKICLTAGGSHLVFAETTVTSVQKIWLSSPRTACGVRIVTCMIDDRRLEYPEIKQLAINEGFNNVQDFIDYFGKKYGEFMGKIIHWTDKKY